MPSLFRVGGYLVYFWSNENFEPIHIHVSQGKPTQNSTKVWLTASGGCILENNSSKIPVKELNNILEIIAAQYFLICRKWKEHFKIDEIKFYC